MSPETRRTFIDIDDSGDPEDSDGSGSLTSPDNVLASRLTLVRGGTPNSTSPDIDLQSTSDD